MLKSGLRSFDTSGRKHLNLQISPHQKLQTIVEELLRIPARSYLALNPSLRQALLLLKEGIQTRTCGSSPRPGATSTLLASGIWKSDHVEKEVATMWDSGFLTFIQVLEDGEQARQAMARRPGRMLRGLAAKRHFERLDPVYASAINLLSDKRRVTYITHISFFPRYLLLCLFLLTRDKERPRPEETRTTSHGLRFCVQYLIETCTITMYSATKHEVF